MSYMYSICKTKYKDVLYTVLYQLYQANSTLCKIVCVYSYKKFSVCLSGTSLNAVGWINT